MTTPAISVSNLTLQSGIGGSQAHFCDGSANAFVNQGTFVYLRRTETRPASTNHPLNRGRWRNPGAWSHSKIVDNPNPPGNVREWSTLIGGSCAKGAFTDNTGGFFWTATGTALPAFPSGLEGRAVSRALLKLKHQQVNLAVAFAERKQTIDMFKKHAKSIAHQVRTYKGKNPKKWGQVLLGNGKNTPNDWLELQYGWKPLISDISGACQALSDLQSGNNPYLARVKGIAGSDSQNNWRKVTNRSAFYGFDVTDKWKHYCKVSLYYKLRNPQLAAFASLGLTNPFELAWEKLKYSFVIDWFLPVGNWLSTLDADFGWDFHSGTSTKFSTGGSSSVYRNTGLATGAVKCEYFGPSYKATGFNMTRTVYASAPWGGIPRFKNPLSGLHVANAVALLAQAFRR